MSLSQYINFDGSAFGARGLIRLLTNTLARSGILIALFATALLDFVHSARHISFEAVLIFNLLTLLLVLVLDKVFSSLMFREPETSVIDKTGKAEGNPAVTMKTMSGLFFTALAYGVVGLAFFNPFFAFGYYCIANSIWNLCVWLKLKKGAWSVATDTPMPDKKVWNTLLVAQPVAAKF